MNALHTFFARLHLKSHGRFLGFGTSPAADWKIIFFSTAFLAVLIIISSVFLFIKIDKGEIFAVEKSVGKTKKVLNTVILRDTISYYQAKTLEFERIKKTKVSPDADPSL